MSSPPCSVCETPCHTVRRFYVITPDAAELDFCSPRCVLRWAVVAVDIAAAGQPDYLPIEMSQDLRQWAWTANLPRATT